MTGPYADLVAAHGLSHAHRLVLAAVPDCTRVLDVGCSTGYLAAELTARGCHVVGVERDPEAAARFVIVHGQAFRERFAPLFKSRVSVDVSESVSVLPTSHG